MSVNPRIISSSDVPTIPENFLVENGQSWSAGQLVYLNGSGHLATCASDGVLIRYLALETQADPADAVTTAKVVRLTRNMLLEMSVTTGAVTTANKGLQYSLDVTSNLCSVDTGDTGHVAFEVEELGYERNPSEFASTDDPGVVWVRLLTTVLEATPA